MATRRALIRESDLRRWARVSREEGVAIRGRVEINGSVTITLDPFPKPATDHDDDFDDRLSRFAAS